VKLRFASISLEGAAVDALDFANGLPSNRGAIPVVTKKPPTYACL